MAEFTTKQNVNIHIQNLPTQKRTYWYWLVGTMLLTGLIFSNTLKNAFVNWDDQLYIYENPLIMSLSLENIYKIFTSFYASNYHPLVALSNAIEYKLFGLKPMPYHAVNVLLHVANTGFVFWFILRLTKNIDMAGIVALIFGIHTMHVESVAWISERKDLLYSLFFLVACIHYLNYLKYNQLKYFAYTFIFFIFSLLSKSPAIVLPAVLLLIDYYKERRFEAKVFVEKIPFFILSFVFAYIALQSQSDVIKDIYTPSFPIYERIFLASYAIVFYVFKFFLPTQLVHLYGYPFVNEGVLGWQYYVAPVFVAFFAWAIFRNRSKREVIFGSFFFLINVALVLQLIPVGKTLVADRYSYLSYIGLGFIIAYWYHHFTSYHKQPKLYWQLTLIVCFVALSVATFKRNQVWKDSFSLWSDALAKSPSSYLKYYYQFGLAGIKREATQYQDAIKDYDAVIALNPKFSLAYHDRAICKVMLKDFKGAMEDCSKAIELDKNFALAYNTRGYAQMQIYDMKLDYARKALQDFSTAISLNPEYTQAYYNRGLAKYDLEKNDEAILDYTKALELSPNYAMVYNDRAAVKYRLQDFKGAIADYTKAIELAPDLYDLYYNRGSCHIFLKQYQNAIDDFSKFLQYKPDIAAAYYYRSMAYLESNNRVNACQDLQKAFQLGERLAQQAIDKNCK